jgi:hypothetical protein
MPSGEWTDGAFPVLDPGGFYSTSGACSVSPFTTTVDRVPWRGVAGGVSRDRRRMPGVSACQCRQVYGCIIAQGSDGFQCHVTSSLDRPCYRFSSFGAAARQCSTKRRIASLRDSIALALHHLLIAIITGFGRHTVTQRAIETDDDLGEDTRIHWPACRGPHDPRQVQCKPDRST